MGFKQGTSGNPSGRPVGSKNKATALRKLLDDNSEVMLSKLIEMAKEGNIQAIRIAVERLLPPVRENKVTLALPRIDSIAGCCHAQASIIEAVANGELLPSEGDALSGLVENRRKALETSELADRIAALEKRL